MESKKLRLASKLTYDSIVDGPGIRMVLWTQGCPHHCPGCHNPQTHDTQGGVEEETSVVIQAIHDAHLQTGLTLSGGEPFDQPAALLDIVKEAKKDGLSIWAYSGYLFEELMKDSARRMLLEEIDILVDGRFMEDQKDYRLRFKGSKNQRIIDVQESLKIQAVVISSYDESNQF